MSRFVFQKGFNLVELLVVIAIVAILMVIAAPNFQSYAANQQVRSANDALLNALNMSRSEAITRNVPVQLEAREVDGDTDWINGWTVSFVSNVDGAEQVLVIRDDLAGVTITSATTDASATTEVTFDRDGRPGGDMTFLVQSANNPTAETRCVRLGLSGAASTRKGAC